MFFNWRGCMRMSIVLLAGLLLTVSGVALAESQSSNKQGAQTSNSAQLQTNVQQRTQLRLQDPNLSESEKERLRMEIEEEAKLRLGADQNSQDIANQEKTEARARLRMEEEGAEEINEASQDESSTNSKPRFGVNRQLDMRKANQMRGR